MNAFPMAKSTIVRTILLGFLFTILPAFILCIVSEVWTIHALQRETEATYSTKITITSEAFSDNLNALQATASTLLLEHDVIAIAAQPTERIDLYALHNFANLLKLQFSSAFMGADVIVAFPQQGMAVSSKLGVDRLEKYPLLEDFSTLPAIQASWQLRPSYRQPERRCLSMLMGYVRPEQSFPVVILEIDCDELTRQMDNLFIPDVLMQSAFFRDVQGEFFTLDQSGLLSEEVLSALEEETKSGIGSGAYYENTGNARLKVTPVYLPDMGCVIGVAFSEQEIFQPILNITALLILVVVLGIAASIIYLFLVYRKIYSPIQLLTDSMRKVANGDLTVCVQVKGTNEFNFLAEQFNLMTRRLNKLVDETYLLEIRLRNAQIHFLRSHINPHFLSNSLFYIYNMIKSQELDSAADMTVYLGRYYRLGAQLDSLRLPLSQEIENIELYLKIHQVRLSGRFSFSCQIQKGLEDFEIPTLSLQTIVENAVQHAFRKLNSPARVDVLASREDGEVVLEVRDNGSGIPHEELASILERLKRPENMDELHGIQNVYFRVMTMYGEETSFEIKPVLPHGTSVVIRVRASKSHGKE
ncbi:MAG: histidine kinase [Acutalibacter sp.]|nr:histidine kinase [Acutalibacter sp.]